MGKYTLVVEFEDGKEPAINGSVDVLGGRIVAAAFMDYRDDFFTENEAEAIEGIMDDSDMVEQWCEDMGVDADEITEKIRLLKI